MEQHVQKEQSQGHLPTQLKGLDAALCGGIPFGVLTELVGPSGIGKTQVTSNSITSFVDIFFCFSFAICLLREFDTGISM